MRTTGAILIVFGVLVLIKPDLIAYILAFICIAIGVQFLLLSGIFATGGKKSNGDPIRFGGYEIYKKNK